MEPYYYQRLTLTDGKIVPNPNKMRPPLEFRVTGWAIAPNTNYRLVFFQEGMVTGEYLYRGREPIAICDGQVAIYSRDNVLITIPRGSVNEGLSLSMNRVDWRVGRYGVPSHVAIALRDPINQTWIIRPEQAGFKSHEPQDEG
jgi:hypothetical protein